MRDTIQTGCFALTNYKSVSVQHISNSEKATAYLVYDENQKILFSQFRK